MLSILKGFFPTFRVCHSCCCFTGYYLQDTSFLFQSVVVSGNFKGLFGEQIYSILEQYENNFTSDSERSRI
jgi:hypothetical protein